MQLVARLHGPGDVRIHEEPLPTTGPAEVALRVISVGLCGSDLHWYTDGAIGEARVDRPLILGHEIAAVIDDGPRRGTRVVLDPADPCGDCAICRGGHEELCPVMRFAGHGPTDGGLRAFMSWPERLLHPVPESIGDAEASLLEALGVAIHAVDLGAVVAGMRVAVVGCGPIGLLVVGALRVAGIDDIMATDLLPHRVEAARRAGAGRVWLAADQSDDPTRGREPPGLEADVVFECAGDEAAVEAAIRIAAPAGRIVLVGIPGGDRTTFTASVARRKGLTLVLCRRMTAADLDRAIVLAAAGRIDLSALITHRVDLEQAPEAFAALAARRGLKIVVQPGRGG
ncbi:MAG TPA: alcohol dehydrogenase catalytic domain-containing protein [Candidatus Limnocylindrales bacterium]|nr:alcohol dehydrogenase catalytic domain-containing protein [Candidatus Limnocylindrales bacterium]